MEGDLLDVNGPHGDFFLQQTPKEAVFIAGGSGGAGNCAAGGASAASAGTTSNASTRWLPE